MISFYFKLSVTFPAIKSDYRQHHIKKLKCLIIESLIATKDKPLLSKQVKSLKLEHLI